MPSRQATRITADTREIAAKIIDVTQKAAATSNSR